MRRLTAVVLALALALALGGVSGAAAAPPDSPGRTAKAKPGSELAKRSSISRRALRRGLARRLRAVGGPKGAWVRDLGTSRRPLLFAMHASRRLILASNQKLFTTATVLDRFGAGRRLETTIYERGQRIGADDGVLDGHLIVVGDGDPALATQGFADNHGLPLTPIRALAADIEEAGIRRVTGKVRADDTVFDRRRGVRGYVLSPYLSPLSGLSFNSGFAGGGYARNPELEAARELRRTLRRRGVRVEGGVGRARPEMWDALEPTGLVRSPSLRRLISATNKPSNNFFAEMLLKRLGATGERRGTTARGARRVEAFAREVAAGTQAVDGSGLGRGNRATPRQVGRLLAAMGRSEQAAAFRESLPVAGREGTVAHRMDGTAAAGRCRAKTGTLRGVSTLSGYCEAGHGLVAFSILMNGADLAAARRAQDAMAALIARYRR